MRRIKQHKFNLYAWELYDSCVKCVTDKTEMINDWAHYKNINKCHCTNLSINNLRVF